MRNSEGRRLSLENTIEGLLNADGLLNSKEDPAMLLKENMIDQNESSTGAEALRNVKSAGLQFGIDVGMMVGPGVGIMNDSSAEMHTQNYNVSKQARIDNGDSI